MPEPGEYERLYTRAEVAEIVAGVVGRRAGGAVDSKAYGAHPSEAVTAERTARLYDAVLRWTAGVEREAMQAGIPLHDYLVQAGTGANYALWLAVLAALTVRAYG